MIMCLGQGADLYMAQLMPLLLTISCSSKSRLVLPFWFRLIQVVPDKIQEGRKTVVCVHVRVRVCLYLSVISRFAVALPHTTTTVLRLCGICPGKPG